MWGLRDRLASGEMRLIVPEGGVTRTGRMSPDFPRAGYVANRPDNTVPPEAIWDCPFLKGPVRIRFGPPIPMNDICAPPRSGCNPRAVDRTMRVLAGRMRLVGGPDQDSPANQSVIPLIGRDAKAALWHAAAEGTRPVGAQRA